MPAQSSLEGVIAAKENAKNNSNDSQKSNTFLGLDWNNLKNNENGDKVHFPMPENGATLFNTMGIAIPGNKTPEPRDPIPVNQEVRELIIKSKCNFGMTLRNFENGIFVSHVRAGTPAAKVGLRFGDQILRIGDKNVAGMKGKDAYEYALSLKLRAVSFIIRDRPLERVVDLTRNDQGQVGMFIVKGGVVEILNESSAENNGVIKRSQICEINGINVIGFPDEKIAEVIKAAENDLIRVTIIPQDFYRHLTKRLTKDVLTTFNRLAPVPLDP
ncbi:unnamed protein product [Rodentolepis nana]|uniref:PDZ domain-containing protein n=1 Tax=Rodentolepis nana TaxID=102285 RepID=A0A0R3TSF2_RODNA|nr:unnamed protein product [Rodentolepis nana]